MLRGDFKRHCTIQQLVDKYPRTGSVVDILLRLRLRITLEDKTDTFLTAATSARVNVWKYKCAISSQTVWKCLKEVALRARRQRRVFNLSDRHRAARLALDDVTCGSHRRYGQMICLSTKLVSLCKPTTDVNTFIANAGTEMPNTV